VSRPLRRAAGGEGGGLASLKSVIATTVPARDGKIDREPGTIASLGSRR